MLKPYWQIVLAFVVVLLGEIERFIVVVSTPGDLQELSGVSDRYIETVEGRDLVARGASGRGRRGVQVRLTGLRG